MHFPSFVALEMLHISSLVFSLFHSFQVARLTLFQSIEKHYLDLWVYNAKNYYHTNSTKLYTVKFLNMSYINSNNYIHEFRLLTLGAHAQRGLKTCACYQLPQFTEGLHLLLVAEKIRSCGCIHAYMHNNITCVVRC